MGIYGNINDLERAAADDYFEFLDFKNKTIDANNKVCEILHTHKEKISKIIKEKEVLEKKVEELESKLKKIEKLLESKVEIEIKNDIDAWRLL